MVPSSRDCEKRILRHSVIRLSKHARTANRLVEVSGRRGRCRLAVQRLLLVAGNPVLPVGIGLEPQHKVIHPDPEVLSQGVPGIGPKTAQAIVDYRTANGPFASAESLLEVKGIGESTLARIRELIVIE